MTIRPTEQQDIPALQEVLRRTGLFPAEMLPDMVREFLDAATPAGIWLTCVHDGTVVGFCYAVPEELTEGTWNMLAIAVLPEEQGRGHGGAITNHMETVLRQRDQRLLIVETSGLATFERTRAFYRGLGYSEEARIRDFWADGDDKIVFWKSLARNAG